MHHIEKISSRKRCYFSDFFFKRNEGMNEMFFKDLCLRFQSLNRYKIAEPVMIGSLSKCICSVLSLSVHDGKIYSEVV